MSRVDSARIAARKAQDAAAEQKLAEPLTKGSVVASDAFFPFADGMLAAIEAGATAVIQPGGSMRDDEVIKAADEPASPWCSPACGISGISASSSRRKPGPITTGVRFPEGVGRRCPFDRSRGMGPGVRRAGDGKTIHVKCDYRLVVDNLMDLTHEAFVHGGSIGNEAVAEAPFDVTHGDKTVTVTRWMTGIEAPPFWAAQLQKPGPVDRWQIIRFEAPGTVNIDVGVAPAGTGAPEGDRSHGVNGYVLNTMTPETATTCHYFWAFVRNHRRTEQRLTTEIREGVSGIFHEDEVILEAQQRAIDENPDRVFYNLNIDTGAMWARRVIDRMVARESAAATVQAAE